MKTIYIIPGSRRKTLTWRVSSTLWQTYLQLTEAEAAFRTLKPEAKVRPI